MSVAHNIHSMSENTILIRQMRECLNIALRDGWKYAALMDEDSAQMLFYSSTERIIRHIKEFDLEDTIWTYYSVNGKMNRPRSVGHYQILFFKSIEGEKSWTAKKFHKKNQILGLMKANLDLISAKKDNNDSSTP